MSEASPKATSSSATIAWHVLALVTAVLMAVTLYLIFFVAPAEEQMGVVQKIFYLHVPSAYCMYVGFSVSAFGGLMYLARRTDRWDRVALAGAEIGMLFCAIVLITGPLWGRKAWGYYWVWDPRLTSTLLTGMIYTAYVGLRSFGEAGEAEKRFASALALIGFPMLFLIKFSVQRWSGQHPVVITGNGGGISSDMMPALVCSFCAFTGLVIWLLWTRIRVERQRQEIWALELETVMGDD